MWVFYLKIGVVLNKKRCGSTILFSSTAQQFEDVRVSGFFVQLMDGFDWENGYTKRYGVHYVDFNNMDR